MAAPLRTPPLAPYDPPPPAAPNGRARRADGARQPHDGWTFVLIPPGTGARPRTLHISVRRLRAIVVAGCSAAGVSVLVMAVLGLVLSAVPKLESEARGIQLGVLAEGPAGESLSTPVAAMPFEIAAPATPTTEVPAATPSVAEAAPAPAPTVASTKTASAKVTAPAPATGNAAARVAPRPIREARVARVAPGPRARAGAAGASDGAAEDAAESHSFISAMPVIGRITSNFSRARRHPLLGIVRRHKGVDIAAPSGTRITAPVDGRVVFAGRRVGFGNVVELVHSSGVMTRYAHCRRINVHVGERVKAGQTIATVGSTGLATGPHLHYEVLVNGESVDPMRHPVTSFLSKDAASAGGVVLPPPPAPSVLPATPPGATALAPASAAPTGPEETPKDSVATPDR